MSLYDRIFKPRIYTLPNGTGVEEKRSRAPLVIVIVALLAILSIRITGFDLSVLVTKGGKFFDILKAMFPPNTAYLGKIWQPLWDTIKMSFLDPVCHRRGQQYRNEPRRGVSRAPFSEPCAHAADARVCADRHVHFRPRHDGRYLRHRRFHVCLCGQAAL